DLDTRSHAASSHGTERMGIPQADSFVPINPLAHFPRSRAVAANDNHPTSYPQERGGRIDQNGVPPPESRLSRLETAVLALAEADGPSSLFEPSKVRRWYRVVTGTRLPNRLANPRLEALRRFAILARVGLASDADERVRIRRAGFDTEQINEIADRASAFHEPQGVFSALSMWRHRALLKLLSKQVASHGDMGEEAASQDDDQSPHGGEQPSGDHVAPVRPLNADLSAHWTIFLGNEGDGPDLRTILTDFGRRLLAAITSPTLLPIFRAVVGDSEMSQGSIRQFFEDGPRAVTDGLADVLRNAAMREEIVVDDCAIAAQQFVGMVRANIHLEVALELRPAPAREEIEHVVHQAVEIFLRGIEYESPAPFGRSPAAQHRRR
ncbi:TetR/AcrR family transcriptional regulator C-terminal domain-containing protein, partial [Sphingobium scionense]